MKKQFTTLCTKMLLALCVLFYSQTTVAAYTGSQSVQGYLFSILRFINNVILPFIFSIALLFFLINVARYFIIGSAESESQEKAKRLALYGIGAFVFMVSLWGIVNMFTGGLNIDQRNALCPDYLGQNWCRSGSNYGGGGFNNGQTGVFLDVGVDVNVY